jgi:hypothetical protein
MNTPVSHFLAAFWVLLTLGAGQAAGQSFESVGERALGMGGAFVAVANDSTATWWNPAGLATGPFLDLSNRHRLGWQRIPATRRPGRSLGLSLGTPPRGVSYYRLKITDIRSRQLQRWPKGTEKIEHSRKRGPVAVHQSVRSHRSPHDHDRCDRGRDCQVRAGHASAYVRLSGGFGFAIAQLLEDGEELHGGETHGRVDVDAGVLASRGPVRLGLTGRNLREPGFGERRLSRQLRSVRRSTELPRVWPRSPCPLMRISGAMRRSRATGESWRSAAILVASATDCPSGRRQVQHRGRTGANGDRRCKRRGEGGAVG